MIQRLVILALSSLALVNGTTASEKETAVKPKLPMMNPWDANQWEAGSDRNFWHAGAEETKNAATAKPSVTSPAKSAPAPPSTRAKSDFSNRQPEK